MASEWQERLFRDICEHSAFGPRFSGDLYAGEGNVATLRTTDISADGRINYSTMPTANLDPDQYARHFLREDDLVITRSGRVGTAAVFTGFALPVLPGAFLIRFRLNRQIAEPEFYRYFFNSPAGQQLIRSIATGSVQQNINITSINRLYVPAPSLQQQRAVLAVLRPLDDKIEVNRKMNETLEAMARALFKSWFVDFDPVRAKAEGRPTGLPDHISALFPDCFEDSELGEIPRGWKTGKLSDLCSTQYGFTASASKEPIGPKFLRVMDINKQNWIEWQNVPYCEATTEDRAHYGLKAGDLIVARMADPGKSAIIEEDVNAVFASYLVRLNTPSLADAYYVYGFLKSDQYGKYAEGAKSGSVQSNMNARVIVGADVVIPSIDMRQMYLEQVLPLRKRLVAGVRESHTLATLRNALLPKLISGEIRLKVTNTEQPNSAAVTKQKKPAHASGQFKEAILIAALVRAAASAQYPLGNFRRTKFSYLVHRKAAHDVQKQYLKKAAGPYDPKSKYAGPVKIAIQNGYVKKASSAKSEGLVSGEKIQLIDEYLPHYEFADAIDWVLQKFKYSKNDDLELFTTVDLAALEIKGKGDAISVDAIVGVIGSDAEWKAKLNRDLFSPKNIRRALQTMAIHFPETYKGMCL